MQTSGGSVTPLVTRRLWRTRAECQHERWRHTTDRARRAAEKCRYYPLILSLIPYLIRSCLNLTLRSLPALSRWSASSKPAEKHFKPQRLHSDKTPRITDTHRLMDYSTVKENILTGNSLFCILNSFSPAVLTPHPLSLGFSLLVCEMFATKPEARTSPQSYLDIIARSGSDLS